MTTVNHDATVTFDQELMIMDWIMVLVLAGAGGTSHAQLMAAAERQQR
jgi:hypothetical protein